MVQAALFAAKNEKGVVSRALKKTDGLLREMVAITVRPDLTTVERTNLETCITVYMHQKVTAGMTESVLPLMCGAVVFFFTNPCSNTLHP
jgi:hypothetical protein